MPEQQLEKAKIKFLDGSQKNQEFTVLFNPAEYTHTIGNKFEEKALPGLANPILQFVNGTVQSLSMDLFFDTWTDKRNEDLPAYLEKFAQMLAIDRNLHAPPPVEFKWGSFAFQAYVENVTQKFTMFDSGGKPVRATLSVSFKQFRTLKEQLEDPRRNSSDRTKRRVFTADDSLWALAAREYGDARYWRKIARFNRIENPRLLQPGSVVLLPPLEEPGALE
jgi:nucleoid-associated protein YgaU